MKLKKVFEKIATYNEIAELANKEHKVIWFADIVYGSITNGEKFASFEDLRKYVRKEYYKEVADAILNAEDWELNSEKEIEIKAGRKLKFELYVVAA